MTDAQRSLQSGPLDQQLLLKLDRVGLRLGQRCDRKGKVVLPGTAILNDASWEIRRGDRWGLVGPAGSGKTALLRLLNRLIEPTQGQLYWTGQPFDRVAVTELRRQILYVPQEPKLLKPTALEAITYPLQLHGIAVQPRLETWITRMELSEALLHQPEAALSSGQRQWISLTRALALEPPVLLLDEPTTALDPYQCDRLRQILQALPQTTTLVIVSQDLPWLQPLCHQGIVIRDRTLNFSADWPAIHEQLRSQKPPQDDDWD